MFLGWRDNFLISEIEINTKNKIQVENLYFFIRNTNYINMKRFIVGAICICLGFALLGCDTETAVKAGHISEITGALSTDYAIKVVLDDDKRVNEKFVDLQIKSSKAEQLLSFGEENCDAYAIFLPKEDYWYNLTYLITQTNGLADAENYQSYDDFGTKVFNFKANNDVDLTFRVVVGQTKTNEETQEEILVLSEPISDEVSVKVKKQKDK